MYHHVAPPTPGLELYVTPETFEQQMEFLKVHDYRVLPLEEAVRLAKAGQTSPPKSVVITFDDGYLDNFNYAFPVLKKMGFPATIFMITNNVNEPGFLSEEDLRILDEAGISIGSHTASHAFLPRLKEGEVAWELAGSKKRLEKILAHPVTLFSYPAGGVTGELETMVKEQGYHGAVTTNYGRKLRDPYALHRVKVSDANGSLFNFWIKTSGLYPLGKKRVAWVPES